MKERTEARIYSVTQLCQDIKLILEASFGEAWVEGEVSNFQAAASGHAYFTLKDDNAVLPAAMFARAFSQVKFKLENGQKVVCFGKVSAYAPRGSYQIIVEKLEPKGAGALQLALEQLKKKLEKEGLFRAEHKRAIPYLPGKIGIVTSLQGAAIKDILKVLDRRFKEARIIIAHAQVQGEGAGVEIAQAIADLNSLNRAFPAGEKIEVMIVGRGGGSIEDLWCFNEEAVARAIYDSAIPVISAVGHERDWTIADLVADLRAPTPSAAAEMVLPEIADLRQKAQDGAQELKQALEELLLDREQEADDLKHKLKLLSPQAVLEQHAQRITELERALSNRCAGLLKIKDMEFLRCARLLASLNPLDILSRGYSVTFAPGGAVVKGIGELKPGQLVRTRLSDGEFTSQVTEAKPWRN
jgi:exodeoxyribonuclease VII large subunit